MLTNFSQRISGYFCLGLLANCLMVISVYAERVPYLGEYVSNDSYGSYSITIESANPDNGAINGGYKTISGPEGPFSVHSRRNIGDYSWVYSDIHGKDGVAPFGITFQVMVRPSDRSYNIYDSWAGAYQEDDTMLMSGVRSYVNGQGDVLSLPLGTFTFKKK